MVRRVPDGGHAPYCLSDLNTEDSVFIFSKGRAAETDLASTGSLPNSCKSQGWAGLKPRARRYIQVSH